MNVPKSEPVWAGRTDGSVWICRAGAAGIPLMFWAPPGAAPAPLIDPAILAQRALDQMQLASPNIHTAPQPPDMTYVGLETWLWMDQQQWAPMELTVSAGPTSVTVKAAPVRATWDLTAGRTTCNSAGRAWEKGMSSSEQTDCSYTFTKTSDGQANDAFPISSTLTYQVDWTCSGGCLTDGGTLGEVDGLPGQAALRVSERQSVVIGGN